MVNDIIVIYEGFYRQIISLSIYSSLQLEIFIYLFNSFLQLEINSFETQIIEWLVFFYSLTVTL